MSEFAGRYSAPDEFDEYDLLDPCCAKEAKNQRLRAAYYAKLRSIDPTRLAVERRARLLKSVNMGERSLRGLTNKALRGTCNHFQRDYINGSGAVHCADCEACDYISDSSDDLDDLLDGFQEVGPQGRQEDGKSDSDDHDSDSSNDTSEAKLGSGDEEYMRILRKRRRELKDAASAKADATEESHAVETLESYSSAGTVSKCKMRVISVERVEMEIIRSSRLVIMIASANPVELMPASSVSPEEKAINRCFHNLADRHAATTTFRSVVNLRAKEKRMLGIDRAPAIVVCIDGHVVARAIHLEQFRGKVDPDTGEVEVALRLEPWLEHTRVIGHGDGGGRRDSTANSDDEDDELNYHDDEDMLPSCGKAGCTKNFHHVHIGLNGIGVDAQLLSVTD